jgi:hypothetical protein
MHSINEWRFLRQIEAFFKKNKIFANPADCAEAAHKTFVECEQHCAATNLRLDFCYHKRGQLDPDLMSQINKMRRYIDSVLGPFHKFMDELPRLVKVTSGATESRPRTKALPQLKMSLKLHATSGAVSYIRAIYRYFGFKPPRIKIVRANRVERVPKNWKTDRTIACEPDGVLPFQLAFDTYGKRRLKKFRINLHNQFANQELAILASICDDFVTVDGKNASSTIAFNAVAWLFPDDWFEYLCRMRSPDYRGVFGDGQYHMFSSMGNGSTFVIETLIFAAACHAVGSKEFLVYGDDVIIEKECFEDYKRLTAFLGFMINTEKTFASGPFRESCGMDSYHGMDVTPVYIRTIDARKATLNHLVNTLASIAFPGGMLANYLLELMEKYKLHLVPYNESTTSGVWIDPDMLPGLGLIRKTVYKRKDGVRVPTQLYQFKAFVPLTGERPFVDSRGYYLWFLNKHEQVLFKGPWTLSRDWADVDESDPRGSTNTSSVSIYQHKYVRKWIAWHKPSNATPLHLYWWSTCSFPLLSSWKRKPKRKSRG